MYSIITILSWTIGVLFIGGVIGTLVGLAVVKKKTNKLKKEAKNVWEKEKGRFTGEGSSTTSASGSTSTSSTNPELFERSRTFTGDRVSQRESSETGYKTGFERRDDIQTEGLGAKGRVGIMDESNSRTGKLSKSADKAGSGWWE